MSEDNLDIEKVRLPRKESKSGISRQTSRAGSPDVSGSVQLDSKKSSYNRKRKANGIEVRRERREGGGEIGRGKGIKMDRGRERWREGERTWRGREGERERWRGVCVCVRGLFLPLQDPVGSPGVTPPVTQQPRASSGGMGHHPHQDDAITRMKNIDQIELGRYMIKPWYFSPYPQVSSL